MSLGLILWPATAGVSASKVGLEDQKRDTSFCPEGDGSYGSQLFAVQTKVIH